MQENHEWEFGRAKRISCIRNKQEAHENNVSWCLQHNPGYVFSRYINIRDTDTYNTSGKVPYSTTSTAAATLITTMMVLFKNLLLSLFITTTIRVDASSSSSSSPDNVSSRLMVHVRSPILVCCFCKTCEHNFFVECLLLEAYSIRNRIEFGNLDVAYTLYTTVLILTYIIFD